MALNKQDHTRSRTLYLQTGQGIAHGVANNPRWMRPYRRIRLAFSSDSDTRFPWVKISFLLLVVIPSILSIIYFSVIASPQYMAQIRLVIRTADPGGADKISSALAAMSASMIAPGNAQNAFIVAHYIRSGAAVADINKTVPLREIYSGSNIDWFAGLAADATNEELVDYWGRMVRAYVDGPSGILSIEVRAFKSEDAVRIATALEHMSERLVNEMSLRARQDVMKLSEEDVRRALAGVLEAYQAFQETRNTQGVIDPAKTAEDTGTILMELMTEKLKLEGELRFVSGSLDRQAPSVRYLTTRLEILNNQIKEVESRLTGDIIPNANAAAMLRKFDELEVRRELAEKLLTFAEDGLERARIRAERQSLYSMVFVPPVLPSEPTYPRRVAFSILMPLMFAMLWSIGALLWASIEDHRY